MHLSVAQQMESVWCNKVGCLDKRVAWYTLNPSEEFNTIENKCWIDLFRSGIVAEHQLSQRDCRGLKIPFEMPMHLAAMENYTWVDSSSEARTDEADYAASTAIKGYP